MYLQFICNLRDIWEGRRHKKGLFERVISGLALDRAAYACLLFVCCVFRLGVLFVNRTTSTDTRIDTWRT